MNRKPARRSFYELTSYLMLLGLWQVVSMFVSPMVLPDVPTVAYRFWSILTDFSSLKMVGITSQRLLIGFSIGVLIGAVLGLWIGKRERIHSLLFPIISIFQTVPPISWLVIALLWFGFNGKPSIFIIAVSTLPLITISVCEGVRHIDIGLMEMAKIYRFSRKKIFFHITVPSLIPFFRSACLTGLGNGWKIAVMGEVLTTNDGIGGMIKQARLNIEPENILAWSLTTVFLFYISRRILDFLFDAGGQQYVKN